jgi:putative transposase
MRCFGYDEPVIRDFAILLIHLLVTIARLFGPGGVRSVVAESLLVKHQLLIINRSRARAPDLRPSDRVIVGLCTIFMRATRLLRSAIVLKPSTILTFHRALVKRKYRLLFTPKNRGKPGPREPSPELVSAIVEMKRRNPSFGYQRIADQISLVFDIEIEIDVVRRVLAGHYRPEPGSNGPSWLTFFGHSKDSLWSVDLFDVNR